MSPQSPDIYNLVSSIITGFLRPPAPAPPVHAHYSLVTADKGKVKGVVVSMLHTERVMKSAYTGEGRCPCKQQAVAALPMELHAALCSCGADLRTLNWRPLTPRPATRGRNKHPEPGIDPEHS